MTAKSAKLTMKVLLIVGILCFFLPFMLLSCEDTKVIDATGMDMVIGEFKNTEGDKVDEEDMDALLLPNFILIGSLGTAIAATVILFLAKGDDEEKKVRLAAILAVIAVVCLILTAVTAGLYYWIDEEPLMEMLNDEDVEMKLSVRPGWIFSLICFTIPAVLGLMFKKFVGNEVTLVQCPKCGAMVSGDFCSFCGEELPKAETAATAKSEAKTCPKCGAKVTGEVCEYCGEKLTEDTAE